MKKWIIIFAVLVLGAFAIPYMVDVNRYRTQIEASLEDQFGRKFSLGEGLNTWHGSAP